MSNLLMQILIAEYVIIAGTCAIDGRWPLVLYWIGAAILNIAVLWGIK